MSNIVEKLNNVEIINDPKIDMMIMSVDWHTNEDDDTRYMKEIKESYLQIEDKIEYEAKKGNRKRRLEDGSPEPGKNIKLRFLDDNAEYRKEIIDVRKQVYALMDLKDLLSTIPVDTKDNIWTVGLPNVKEINQQLIEQGVETIYEYKDQWIRHIESGYIDIILYQTNNQNVKIDNYMVYKTLRFLFDQDYVAFRLKKVMSKCFVEKEWIADVTYKKDKSTGIETIKSYKIDPAVLANNIIHKYHVQTSFETWALENNKWSKWDEQAIRQVVNQYVEEHVMFNDDGYTKKAIVKGSDLATTIENIRSNSIDRTTNKHILMGTERNGNDEFLVQFNNGTLDLQNWEWYEHQFFPEKHIITPIDIDYVHDENPEKHMATTASLFKAMLEEMLDDKQAARFLLGWIGTIPIRALGFQVGKGGRASWIVLFYGPGGEEGKSELTDIIRQLVGDYNTSNALLDQLNSRFGKQCLYGKLLNVSSEIPSYTKNDGAEILKSMTSEKDKIKLEKKGSNSEREIFNTASVVFVSNKKPKINDDTHAIYQRMVSFVFVKKFTTDMMRKYDSQQFVTSQGRMEILRYCMFLAHKARKAFKINRPDDDDVFVMSQSMKEARDEWFAKGADITSDMKESIEYDERVTGIPAKALSIFVNWMHQNSSNQSHIKYSNITIGEKLEALFTQKSKLSNKVGKTVRTQLETGWDTPNTKRHKSRIQLWRYIRIKNDRLQECLDDLYQNRDKTTYYRLINALPTQQLQCIVLPDDDSDDIDIWFKERIKPYIYQAADDQPNMHDAMAYTMYIQYYKETHPEDRKGYNLMSQKTFKLMFHQTLARNGYKIQYIHNDPEYRMVVKGFYEVGFNMDSYEEDYREIESYPACMPFSTLDHPFGSRTKGWYIITK